MRRLITPLVVATLLLTPACVADVQDEGPITEEVVTLDGEVAYDPDDCGLTAMVPELEGFELKTPTLPEEAPGEPGVEVPALPAYDGPMRHLPAGVFEGPMRHTTPDGIPWEQTAQDEGIAEVCNVHTGICVNEFEGPWRHGTPEYEGPL